MFYAMRMKLKLAKIVKKRQPKRKTKKSCIFHMSCPELDAIMGPPRRKPGKIVIHPIHALHLINKGLKSAKEAGDRKGLMKLMRHRQHVQAILRLLEVYSKMARLNIQERKESPQVMDPK
ncbi:uncharacterized protein [Drosophila kikkawai]|uniref:Uncharacterized protein LOC108076043 n=1 Tax=Drosophila kikkawai TaxID=30033 RepID=A0A6P4I5K7_DROKI|nr:uncharacterized protein LOC108076043 [Drosophila kikkawai]XP_017024192.1 uncharacterized protein LOC108076043 [Drosophila kikkawai]XP_041630948.1 uncharacterized protein LOC108076043 [Drosophila kikkawai]